MRTFLKLGFLSLLWVTAGYLMIGPTPDLDFLPFVTQQQVANEGQGDPHQKCVSEHTHADGQLYCHNSLGQDIVPDKRFTDRVWHDGILKVWQDGIMAVWHRSAAHAAMVSASALFALFALIVGIYLGGRRVLRKKGSPAPAGP